MKQFSRLIVCIPLLVISLCILPQFAMSQVGSPDDPGDDPDAPIDGGVGILVAAGVIYGIKKFKETKKEIE